MSGPDKVPGTRIATGKGPDRIAALLGGNARRQPMLDINRYGKGGAMGRFIGRDHWLKIEPSRIGAGYRGADDPAAIADDESHFFRRAKRCGTNQISLVFAVVVIGDNDNFTACNRFDRLRDRMRHCGTLLGFLRLKKIWHGGTARLTQSELRGFAG